MSTSTDTHGAGDRITGAVPIIGAVSVPAVSGPVDSGPAVSGLRATSAAAAAAEDEVVAVTFELQSC